MKDTLVKLYLNARGLMNEDSGQDLIEYALVVALIAFAAVVGMTTIAADLNIAFSKIASKLTSSIT